MRKNLFIGVAAILLGGTLPAQRAEALMPGPAALAATTLHPTHLHRVVNICGTNGCVPVQTKRIMRRQKPGGVAANHI